MSPYLSSLKELQGPPRDVLGIPNDMLAPHIHDLTQNIAREFEGRVSIRDAATLYTFCRALETQSHQTVATLQTSFHHISHTPRCAPPVPCCASSPLCPAVPPLPCALLWHRVFAPPTQMNHLLSFRKGVRHRLCIPQLNPMPHVHDSCRYRSIFRWVRLQMLGGCIRIERVHK